jgi:Na+/H+-dicarboxylate symporter
MKLTLPKLPFFVWILAGLLLGLATGAIAHQRGADLSGLKVVSGLVLQALQLLATPLIFVAVVLSFIRAQISGRSGWKLGWLLVTNTLMAIVIGLTVVNVLGPCEDGDEAGVQRRGGPAEEAHPAQHRQPLRGE